MKSVAAFVVALAMSAPAAAQEVYTSDPAHTYAFFEIGHLGISWIRGRFNDVQARITLDRAARQGSIEANVRMASVDTAHEARDKHLRSSDYLDVEKFPTMAFKSSNLKFDGDRLVAADGELTLMGVTHPVTLEIPFFRCAPHPTNKREMCGADGRTMIKRSAFGIKRGANIPMHDEVRIAIQIEAYKQ
jgi:polyisoprenoid-binding protein YceI